MDGTETSLPQPSKADIILLAGVVDHLVDSMGDAGASLRRAMILLDIDQHPNTSQNAVGERLGLEKSVISRNVDWLWERGCVMRSLGVDDARETLLQTSAFTHKHLQLALQPFGNHHEVLKKSLKTFISLFTKHMPSLRELKAMLTVGAKGAATRADVIDNLYDGPPTTDQRAIKTLIEEGVAKQNG